MYYVLWGLIWELEGRFNGGWVWNEEGLGVME